MSELLESINNARESEIASHYEAARSELKEQSVKHPFKTEFKIHAGCISEAVTKEIAHRMKEGGVDATVMKAGFLFEYFYLKVKIELPEKLIHEEPVTEASTTIKVEIDTV